ncbi:hypothetical protein ABIB85_004456 [Bradyrhizobium sp. JR1.5]
MTPAAGSPLSMTKTGARPKEPIRCRCPSRSRPKSTVLPPCRLSSGDSCPTTNACSNDGLEDFRCPHATCLLLSLTSARIARVPFSSSRLIGWTPCEATPRTRSIGSTTRRSPNVYKSYARITPHGGCRAIPDNSALRVPNPKPPCFCKRANGEFPLGAFRRRISSKPPTGHFDGHAENEHICLMLARNLGLPVADTEVINFG